MNTRMSNCLKLIFTVLACGLFSEAKAQNLLPLDSAIAIALRNNYDIRLVKTDLAMAKNNVSIGGSGMLPAISGNFSNGGGRQNTVQTQSTGTERRINGARNTNLSYGINLDWVVFDGFKMFANYDRFKALEQQSTLAFKSQVLTTIANVIASYYNLAKQQQLIKAADTAIKVSKMRVNIAQNKLQLGKGSKLDLLAAQVDYNTDTSAYLTQKNLRQNYIAELNRLLAREITTATVVNEQSKIDSQLDYNTLLAQTNNQNPDLQNALINKKIAELNLKQIRADRYPRIALNSSYEINKNTAPTGFNTQFQSRGITYGVTASLNIFNGFMQNQNERNAKLAIASSQISFDKAKQELIAQLATTYQNYQTFLLLMKVEADNLDIANQNLDITIEKYRLGNIAPLALREAQRNAIDAKNRYVEVAYQTKIAEVALKQLSGTLNM